MNSQFNEKEMRKRCGYMTVVEIRSKHLLELLDRIKELEEALAKAKQGEGIK